MTRWAPVSLVLLSVLFVADGGAAFAVILHADGDNAPLVTPSPDVTGRWLNNATFVVIGPNHILTTRHQGSDSATPVVEIAGEPYQVLPSSFGVGGPDHHGDLKVLQIERMDGQPANLTDFTPIYTNCDEVGKRIVMGGFGKVRGEDVTVGNTVVAYDWADGGRKLVWGQNTVDRTGSWDIETPDGRELSSPILWSDFDMPGAGGSLPAEGAAAEGDSGGGWFIDDGGTWKVAALMAYAQHVGRTDFRSPIGFNRPDWNKSVRVSSYAPWINDILGYEPVGGDTNRDGDVDYADYVTLQEHFGDAAADWDHGDFDRDGRVTYRDYLLLKANYGYEFVAQPIEPVPAEATSWQGGLLPEPGTLALLAMGAVAAGVGRRRRARLR
jgi:hypothetical protein